MVIASKSIRVVRCYSHFSGICFWFSAILGRTPTFTPAGPGRRFIWGGTFCLVACYCLMDTVVSRRAFWLYIYFVRHVEFAEILGDRSQTLSIKLFRFTHFENNSSYGEILCLLGKCPSHTSLCNFGQ